jgi:hypothetical protein
LLAGVFRLVSQMEGLEAGDRGDCEQAQARTVLGAI